MRKLTALILSLLVALPLAACRPRADAADTGTPPPSATAAAETAAPAMDAEIADKLNATLPVLDSIVRAMGIEGEVLFSSTDALFLWSTLYLIGVNWGAQNPLVTADGDAVVVPRDVMEAYAAAAFCGLEGLPDVPAEYAEAIQYDAAAGAYRLTGSDMGDNKTKVDAFSEEDGIVDATVGLYRPDGTRLGAIQFQLVEAEPAEDGAAPAFPYVVMDAALVEEPTATWRPIDVSEPADADLDGDGETETLTVQVDENAWTTTVTIVDGGKTYTDKLDEAFFYPEGHIGDASLDDGSVELYLSGDVGSDDYVTEVYRIKDGQLSRTEIPGTVLLAEGNGFVRVSTVVDVLGTYGATCDYRLDSAAFSYVRASDYSITRYDGFFDDRVLTLQKDGLPADDLANAAAVKLPAGTRLVLAETDEKSYALLETQDGVQYRVQITQPENDWIWYIDGTPEQDWFGELMYAG